MPRSSTVPDAAQDREHLYAQLLTYFDQHGVLPDFTLREGAPVEGKAAPSACSPTRSRKETSEMKTPVTTTAVHLDAAKTSDRALGNIKVSVEIDGQWLELLNEPFDPNGFHISHIVEGAGMKTRQNALQLLRVK